MKTVEGKNIRIVHPFDSFIYASLDAIPDLIANGIPINIVKKRTYLHSKSVVEIKVPHLSQFESFINHIERITSHKIVLYNADIKPEQAFLYQYHLCPFKKIQLDKDYILPLDSNETASLLQLNLEINPCINHRQELKIPVRSITFNGELIKGTEISILTYFVHLFKEFDPDVISINRAYAVVPYLLSRLKHHNIPFQFDRWDSYERKYRGGRSYWSYNQVRFQDFSIKLHGRLLIDQSTFVGSECDTEGIIEMVQLSGTLFQQTVARSFGAVFQSALVKLMVQEDMIVPFKDKPLEPPLSMYDMLKADRGGLTIDPKIGFHTNVAELDFVSMFPWLIYNHNISADCILSTDGPFEEIPDLPVKVSLKQQGLIPRALKPFIDRRMYYKANPSEIHSRRAKGLKWILVSCYGYLRYREFKLGIPTSHMAICAFARQVLLQCVHLAEDRGFNVIHGIVDSIYISKPGMTETDVELFRQEVESIIKIPLTCEGIFKWVVFCSSRVDEARALPSTYFGVFNNGDIKARGIEVRQRGIAPFIKILQESVLKLLKDCTTPEEILSKLPEVCAYARSVLDRLSELKPSLLTVTLKVSQSMYKHNIPQKIVVEKLLKKGIKVEPGQSISYIFSSHGPVLVEEYMGLPDKARYTKLVIRALAVLFESFGVSRKQMGEMLVGGIQLELDFKTITSSPEPKNTSIVHNPAYAI